MQRLKQAVEGLAAEEAARRAGEVAAGWFDALFGALRAGQLQAWARVGGVFNFVAISLLSCVFVLSLFPHSMMCLLVGVGIGIVELPFCCWCIPPCKKAATVLAPLKAYWMRGCGYVLLSAFMATWCFRYGGGTLMLFFALMILLDGLCYIAAHAKGESEEEEDEGYAVIERGSVPKANPADAAMEQARMPGQLSSPEDFAKLRSSRSVLSSAPSVPDNQ